MIPNFSFKIITMHCSTDVMQDQTCLHILDKDKLLLDVMPCPAVVRHCVVSMQLITAAANRVVRYFLRKRLSCMHVLVSACWTAILSSCKW